MVAAVGDEEQNKLRFNMSGDELDVFRLATDACGSASRRRPTTSPSSSHRGTNILCSCLRGLAWQLPVTRKPGICASLPTIIISPCPFFTLAPFPVLLPSIPRMLVDTHIHDYGLYVIFPYTGYCATNMLVSSDLFYQAP